MTSTRIIKNDVDRLRGSLGNSTPGHWRWSRVHPDEAMRRAITVTADHERPVLTIAADSTNSYRVQDIVLACQAHNFLEPVLDELEFQSQQSKAAFEALQRVYDVLLTEKFVRPSDMAAIKIAREALKSCRVLDFDPDKPRPRKRALNIT